MQITLREKECKVFKPFSLTINFENREEVIALLHQLNISTATVEEKKMYQYPFDRSLTESVVYTLWDILFNKLKESE